MFYNHGAQLAVKRVSSESVAAREFFRILSRWSSGEYCRGMEFSSYYKQVFVA